MRFEKETGFNSNRYVILNDTGVEVGWINFHNKDSFLKSIKIYEEFRGIGYGKKAVEKLTKENEKLKVSKLKSKKMKGILQSLGFEKEKGITKNENKYYWINK